MTILPSRIPSSSVDPLHFLHRFGNQRLDPFQPFRVDRAAGLIADFEAVICGRVVRGRDVDRPASLLVHNRKGNDRVWASRHP